MSIYLLDSINSSYLFSYDLSYILFSYVLHLMLFALGSDALRSWIYPRLRFYRLESCFN